MLKSIKFICLISLCTCLLSCSKEKTPAIIEREAPFDAIYKISVRLNWQGPAFTVPATAHVTALIGMVHSKEISLWSPGTAATLGLEDVAEEGKIANINLELDGFVAAKTASLKFTLPAPAISGGLDSVLYFNKNFSCISFASMIAPSPDWFMGLHDVNLFQNNDWVKDTTINLMVYDAGTEDGDIFGYDNPETTPRQNISLLTANNAMVLANGNSAIAAIGTIRFIKN